MTALENVAMGRIFAGSLPEEAYADAEEVLKKVGLGERLGNLPSEVCAGRTAVRPACFVQLFLPAIVYFGISNAELLD